MEKNLLEDLKKSAGQLNNKIRIGELKNTLNKEVLLSAHFKPEVRKALKLIALENDKSIKQILGEAINDVCKKYSKPEPYGE